MHEGERTIGTEGEEYQELQELKKQLRDQWQGDMSMTQGLPGTEVAAIDPSDWRNIVKILQAGKNPDDYIEKKVNRGGLMSLV